MTILVFGRAGQVADALLKKNGARSIEAAGRDDCDLMTPDAASALIERKKPSAIINAAAYTAVDNAETEKDAARRLNADAPAEMAEAASKVGAPFIHLSTDYVFDGASAAPYGEDASTNPLNVYGASKCDGEAAVLAANTDAVVMRTSWVFSQAGANFVKTMLRLGRERDALSIVADQIGGPTAADDIAAAALKITDAKANGAAGRGLYHFQGAPAVSWADFARAIFDGAGLDVAVTDIATKDYPTPAQRPLKTILNCEKINADFGVAQPDWRSSLKAVLGALAQEETAS
ncbi:MAG: dTDP-4-dehydrorhamnose reductase [Pseudomonadota bacterium]